MATNSTNTLAGLLMLNDQNMAAIYPTDVLNDAPVVRALFAQTASQGGTLHKYLRELTAPGVGFRSIGQGLTNAAGTFEDVSITCALLDGSFTRDKAAALGYRGGAQAYMDKEGLRSLRAAFYALEQSIFTSNTINQQFNGLLTQGYYDIYSDDQVILASATAGKSCWVLRTSEDGISIIAGNEGRVDMAAEDATVLYHPDKTGVGTLTGLHRSLLGWFGLQVGSKYDAVRICNLDASTNGKLTDILIAQAIAKFPSTRQPNMIAMNRTCLAELQASRTATNPTGAPAPFPMESFGVPIVVTDALPATETVVASTTTATTTATTTSTQA
jgi:hypothetical protein